LVLRLPTAEGDRIHVTRPTPETLRTELDHMAQCYGPPPQFAVTRNRHGRP